MGELQATNSSAAAGKRATASVNVLLTGGPGAGKSSALATLRDRLSKRGFQVIVVPENATPLLANAGGYDPSWSGTQGHVELQRIFLKYQIEQENAYRRIAQLREKPCVLLHDRGCLDGRLFCTEEQWAAVLDGVGVSEADLLRRYDLVVHMASVASGMEHLYDYGLGSSNPSRYHTPEQARQADLLAQEIYASHPQVRVAPNFSDFSRKLGTVVRYTMEAVHVDGLTGPRVRETLPVVAMSSVWPVERAAYETQVTFLNLEFTESIRKRKHMRAKQADATVPENEESDLLYEYRQERTVGDQTYCARKVLDSEAFHLLKGQKAGSSVEVRKRAVCFVWQGSYYELLSYYAADGAALPASSAFHGCHMLDKPSGAPTPPWLAAGSACGRLGSSVGDSEPLRATSPQRTPPRRELARRTTAEAASSMEKVLQRKRLAALPDDQREPDPCKAAASAAGCDGAVGTTGQPKRARTACF